MLSKQSIRKADAMLYVVFLRGISGVPRRAEASQHPMNRNAPCPALGQWLSVFPSTMLEKGHNNHIHNLQKTNPAISTVTFPPALVIVTTSSKDAPEEQF